MKPPRPPTMKDIARAAGVSAMTVCRILRNDPRHQGAIRERVIEVAADLGYKKNPIISELMSRVRRRDRLHDYAPTLALLHSKGKGSELHPNLKVFRAAVRKRASELGCVLDSFPLLGSEASPQRTLEILRTRGVRGLVFEHLNAGGYYAEGGFDFDLQHFACIAISHSMRQPILNRVVPADYGNARLAFQRLTEAGYQRIGLVEPTPTYAVNLGMRSAGVREAQAQLPARRKVPNLITLFDAQLDEKLNKWIGRHAPDAVIGTGSQLEQWIEKHNARCGNRIAFFSLDLSPEHKGKTGVDPEWAEIGRAAVEHLIEQLSRNEFGVPSVPRVIEVPGRWVSG